MKLNLVVLTAGKSEGKVIPVTLAQFVIGRDPDCQLRPASALISKRHCAVLVRNGKVFVRDFDSTNGTFVNDVPVKGERELSHQDKLKAGPLLFEVRIEATPAVNKPTPLPANKAAAGKAPAEKPAPENAPAGGGEDDESVAAMLLALQDDGPSSGSSGIPEVPEGSTVMEIMTPKLPEEEGADKGKPAAGKPAVPKENTSSAAKSILEKYMRRPRNT